MKTLIVLLLMTISINTVAFAETLKYRVADFQIGILYMNNDGTYDSHEAFEAALKRYSLGGLPFGETIKRFEGGTHYYYSDLIPNDEQIIEVPYLSKWDLMDGKKLFILWKRNTFGIDEPKRVLVTDRVCPFTDLLKLSIIYSYKDLQSINPLIVRQRSPFPNALNFDYLYSVWQLGNHYIVSAHLSLPQIEGQQGRFYFTIPVRFICREIYQALYYCRPK